MVRRPVPRTPLQRALYPVLGGIGFFLVLALATWIAAAILSRNPDQISENLAATTFEVGSTESLSSIIADEGPLIFPDLVRSGGVRTVVLDHTGDDPAVGWVVYYAYPTDRDLDCKVTQVKRTRTFTDCEGRTLDVEDLAPPTGVFPIVSGETIIIDLQQAAAGPSGTDPTGTTSGTTSGTGTTSITGTTTS